MSNDEWLVDCADPSVGIFSDLIMHNECPNYDEELSEALEDSANIIDRDRCLVDVTINFKCQACGAIYSVVTQELRSDFEPPNWWDEDSFDTDPTI